MPKYREPSFIERLNQSRRAKSANFRFGPTNKPKKFVKNLVDGLKSQDPSALDFIKPITRRIRKGNKVLIYLSIPLLLFALEAKGIAQTPEAKKEVTTELVSASKEFKNLNISLKSWTHPVFKDLKYSELRKVDEDLIRAIAMSDLDALKLAIKNGANINIVDYSRGLTPLHLALMNNEYAIFDFLIKKKANINVRDSQGNSLLFYFDKHMDLLRYNEDRIPNNYLVEERIKELISRFDINSVNNKGHSLVLMSAVYGHKTLLHYLLEAGAKVSPKEIATYVRFLNENNRSLEKDWALQKMKTAYLKQLNE